MIKWKEKKDCDEESDVVAKPLRAPYTPAEMKSRNSMFVRGAFPLKSPRGGGAYYPLRTTTTYSLTPPNAGQNNRYFQTHSLFHIDKSDRGMCPVSITTTRRLDPVRVGAGVVLTKVVQVLEEFPLKNDEIDAGSCRVSSDSPRSEFLVSSGRTFKWSGDSSKTSPNPDEDEEEVLQMNQAYIRVPPNSASNVDSQLFVSSRKKRR